MLKRLPAVGFVLAIAWFTSASEDVSVEGQSSPAPLTAASQPLPDLHLVRLGAIDTALTVSLPSLTREQRSDMNETRNVGPVRIGFHRDLPTEYQDDLTPRLRWIRDPEDGSVSAAVTVTSPGAVRVRLAIRASLPRGAEMRFFRGSPPEVVDVLDWNDFQATDPGDSGIRWSPSVAGAVIGFEITLPSADARDQTTVEIDRLAHQYRPILRIPSPQPEQSNGRSPLDHLDCSHVDIRCRDLGETRHAVAKIAFEKQGGPFACSGTLMNDTDVLGFIPYFLTANHCVATQSVADTVEAWWFYEYQTCGGTQIDPRSVVTSGRADLLATTVAQDSTLLRLNHRLPDDLWAAGWSAADLPSSRAVEGIHHPGGHDKKYVAGVTRTPEDRLICDDPDDPDDCFLVKNSIPIDATYGAIEGGSSGSGLWHGGHLVGVLSGRTGCRDASYGRFSDFFPHVRQWLSPDRIGIGEVAVQPSSLQVREGGESSYTLSLSVRPTASVTVAARPSGDRDISVSPARVTFTADAWSSALEITVSAAEDGDTDNGFATIGHTVTSDDVAYDGVRVAIVTVTEKDNDRRAGAVGGVSARATDEPGELVITWNPVPGADAYVVEWRQRHGSFVSDRLRVIPGTVTSTTLTNLVGDAFYVVRVTARQDDLLDGSPSTPIGVLTSPYARPFLRGWRIVLPKLRDDGKNLQERRSHRLRH